MTPDKCPHCGAGPYDKRLWACFSYRNGDHQSWDCVEANLRARVIDTERQLSDALARVAVLEEADRSNNASIGMFRARVRELESVVNDPEALWANWLRGTVKLPAGIGDVRAANDRVRELEERIAKLVEAGGLTVQHCAPAWLDDEARAACKARAVEAWTAAKEAKL